MRLRVRSRQNFPEGVHPQGIVPEALSRSPLLPCNYARLRNCEAGNAHSPKVERG